MKDRFARDANEFTIDEPHDITHFWTGVIEDEKVQVFRRRFARRGGPCSTLFLRNRRKLARFMLPVAALLDRVPPQTVKIGRFSKDKHYLPTLHFSIKI